MAGEVTARGSYFGASTERCIRSPRDNKAIHVTRPLDEAKARFDALLPELRGLLPLITTEEDTRLHLIDQILVTVLQWPREQIRAEPKTDSGYIDYLIGQSGRSRWVVEAKRLGADLIDVHDARVRDYKVSGGALKSASDGIVQARRYCAEQGAMFAALTNGKQWIAVWAVRSDGVAPGDGNAIVFPSLEAIADEFARFYELFSPEGVGQQLYQVVIHEAEGLKAQPVVPLTSALQRHEVRMLAKTPHAADLQQVFRSFFSSLSGDSDPDMLPMCFVESRESRDADAQLRKIAENLVNDVRMVESGRGGELQAQIEASIDSGRGEFVVIIGNKGAGKTTFIDRFFKHVLSRQVRDKCVVVRIDLADASPDVGGIVRWITDELALGLEGALFADGVPTFDDLQGAFFDVYQRWRNGEYRPLYERDKSAFKEKFGEHVAKLIETDKARYALALLRSAARSRRLLPCLIFDNADQHSKEIQETVFQFAQSVFRQTMVFVICPVTDRTIWSLSKSGPLQSYDYRALYLPVPSTKDVIAKRVEYLRGKADEVESGQARDYFTERGIRVRIPNIKAFAAVVERIFISEEYVGRLIGWLSNFDIRRSLRIAERIITSPMIKLEDLIKTYIIGERTRLRRREALRALLCGEYQHFVADDNDYLANLFISDADAYTTPLLRLSVLKFLRDRHIEDEDSETAYVTIADVLNYFEPCGITRRLASRHLSVLLQRRLIEPYSPIDDGQAADDTRVRISYAGRQHFDLCFSAWEAAYLSEMALTTPLRDGEAVARIREQYKYARDWRSYQEIIRVFVDFLLREDKVFVSLPSTSIYDGQRDLRKMLAGVWLSHRPHDFGDRSRKRVT